MSIYALFFAGHMLVSVPFGPANHLGDCLYTKQLIMQNFVGETHRFLDRNLKCVRMA